MRKFLISLMSIIFIISIVTTAYAANGNISASASSESVIKGKTFTVTIAGTADNNITALQAKLTYDSSKLSIESKSAGTGFSDVSGANEIAIASTSSENLSKSGTLYTITFKVLETAAEGETTISVSNAVLALVNEQAVQENTAESSDEVTITIKADDTTVDNQGNQNNQDNTQTEDKNDVVNNIDNNNEITTPSNTNDDNNNDNSSSNSDNNKNESTNKNVSTNKNTNKNTTKLPQTGAGSASIIAIIALVVVSIASYVSYRKYKNI